MKKIYLLLVLMLLLSTMMFAQATKPKLKTTPKRGLVATALGSHSIQLSGCADTTPNVTFNFYQGTAAGQESTTAINSTPQATCSFVAAGLTGLTTYYFVAKAFCSTCSTQLSNPSNEINVTTPADPQPAAPTGLTGSDISQNHVPLKWQAPVSQNGYTPVAYELFRGKTKSPTALISILPSSTTSYVDTKCTLPCYYGIKSYDITGMKFELSPISNIFEAE
jgi:hypothetical protein